MNLATIVEGHGEVEALPVLLRRLATDLEARVTVLRPIRLPRSKLVKRDELTRAVCLAANQTSAGDAILVVLDADEDCPAQLGPQLQQWARAARPDRSVAVVLAQREFEAWFVAAADSLALAGKLHASVVQPTGPETLSDPKGWVRAASTDGEYSPRVDQARFASAFDWKVARRADSFDKFVREVGRLLRVAV